MVNGQWWGHIGFDDCVSEHNWSESERAVLETIAYLLGDAIELSTSSLVMSEATRVAMLQTAPDGIVFIDEDGAILEFNPAAEAIFGYRRTLVLGRPVAETLVPPERRRAIANFTRQLQRGGGNRSWAGTSRCNCGMATGQLVPVELAITEIVQGGRRLFVAYIRDLSERKRSEAEVARQREALHQSEKLTALGSLLAGVAHELNNPLSVVIGTRRDARRRCARPGSARKARPNSAKRPSVARAYRRLFLPWRAKARPCAMPTSLNTAITSALELVAYPLRSSGVKTVLKLSADLPEAIADPDQLVQVFVNLFVNADHAMREIDGERILTVMTEVSADGKSVVAEVRDTGIGIDPAIRPRVFEPFFTTKSMGMGTGMGLAVSFGMVAAHGGELQAVDPPDGTGACIRLTLPIRRSRFGGPAASIPADRCARQVVASWSSTTSRKSLRSACRYPRARGHRADKAAEGAEALDLLRAARPMTRSFAICACRAWMDGTLGGKSS